MLEEKNDNLLEADGSVNDESNEVTIAENQEFLVENQEETETISEVEPVAEEVVEPISEVSFEENVNEVVEEKAAILTEYLTEDEIEVAAEKEALVEETINSELSQQTLQVAADTETDTSFADAEKETFVADAQTEPSVFAEMEAEVEEEKNAVVENIVELSNEEVSENSSDSELAQQTDSQSVINAIEEVNAEESEDETLKDRHDIPMLDYDTLSMEQLVDELGELVLVEKLMSVKDHVEELKKSFLSKYHHLIDEKKEEFITENPETTEDFHYHFPLKVKFDELYSQYRDKKNNHFQSLQNNLKANLENRLAIVEELKNLIHSQDNIPVTLKKFNDIRDRWKVAGPIPKDKYNHVWNNYHFHLENFYDVLHLDREIRDLDFKHNLVQKLKIIDRVEELVKEEDINKAFRELQDLHRIWKEDIGPVSRDKREDIWNRFSELTKQMHDKREELFEKLREVEKANLEKKKEIIANIEVLAEEKVNSHAAWLGQIEKVEALRNQFFGAGKVPSEVTDQTWTDFKNAVRSFNVLKNSIKILRKTKTIIFLKNKP